MAVAKKVTITLFGKNVTGRAFAKLKANFNSVKKLAAAGWDFGKKIALSAGVAAVALTALIKRSANVGDKLDKMSQQIGVSVEFLDGMGHAAQISGADVDAFAKGIKRMDRNVLDSLQGLKTAQLGFKMLKISLHDNKGELKDNETLFLEVADKMGKMEDGAKKTALAQYIFGRAGADLIPLFNLQADGINKLMKESRVLSNFWTKDTAAAAATMNDSLTSLWRTIGGVADRFAGKFFKGMTASTDAMIKFYKANKKVIDLKIEEWAGTLSSALDKTWNVLVKWGTDTDFAGWWKTIADSADTAWQIIKPIGAAVADIFTQSQQGIKESGIVETVTDPFARKAAEEAKLEGKAKAMDWLSRQSRPRQGRVENQEERAARNRQKEEWLQRELDRPDDAERLLPGSRQQAAGGITVNVTVENPDAAGAAVQKGLNRAIKEQETKVAAGMERGRAATVALAGAL